MSQEATQEEIPQSLGTFLREQREQKGISLTEATEATKISPPVLKAIEEDAYDRMPAEAFCKGFYSLYASFLGLDPKEILERYEVRNGPKQKSSKKPCRPPVKKSQSGANYAEPSAISPVTSLTLFVAVCLVVVAGICWYFNWAPIDYLNTKLIPPQPPPPISLQQTQAIQETPAVPEAVSVTTETTTEQDHSTGLPKENPSNTNMIQPEEAASAVILPTETNDLVIEGLPQEVQAPPSTVGPYHLEIVFNNSGTLKVTLDDGFVLDKHFSIGETLRWGAEKKIILDMPEIISGTLRLNGIEIPLPEAKNGRRRLSLPEDLLN